MPKNTKRRSPSQIARDRRKIAEMYLQGRYQEEIATALGIDQTTVSRDIKHLLDNWQRETGVDVKQRQAELEQKYLWLWREATAAWLKSKEDAETTIQEMVEADKGDGKGRLKASTRKEGQSGNPALLAQAQAALRALREIFGTDAPAKPTIIRWQETLPAGFDPGEVERQFTELIALGATLQEQQDDNDD